MYPKPLLAASAVGVRRTRYRRRLPYCRGGYRRTSRVLVAGKCDEPRSTAERERQEEKQQEEEEVAEEVGEQEEDNDGNEDGHEDDRRGPLTTRRCRARRSRRRAATCGGRVGKTETGSPCRREPRVSERASELTN